jgi:hypothetical protein
LHRHVGATAVALLIRVGHLIVAFAKDGTRLFRFFQVFARWQTSPRV